MQARQVLSRGSRNGLGVAVLALIVAIGAVLAITFATSGSGKPSAPSVDGPSTQSVGNYSDLQPDRTNTHGALP